MKYLIFAAALAVAPVHLAAQAISASDPGSVSFALQALGLEAQTGTQENGAPAIVSKMGDVTFTVLFYNCAGPRGCRDLQLRALYAPDSAVPLERLNDWNRAAFIGKAYRSEDNVILEHAIAGADGLSRYSFTQIMARWQLALSEFPQVFRAP